MVYSRDTVVKCLTRHYDLLVRVGYLDSAVVLHPPSSGWNDEQLAVDVLRALGRSEEVIDLLRHLPYLRRNLDDEKWIIFPETRALSYLRNVDYLRGVEASSCHGKGLADYLLMPFPADYPAGMISLTTGRDATFWIIDTEQGVVFPAGYSLLDSQAPEDQPWRRVAKPNDIQAYFDEVYHVIETLELVPRPVSRGKWEQEILPRVWPEGNVVKRLLIEHGWPDAFRKNDYLQAVRNPSTGSTAGGVDDEMEESKLFNEYIGGTKIL